MNDLTQYYLPIIARETKKVLGVYNLGANVSFVGTETTYALGAGPVAIELWTPTPSLIRPVNQSFMAAVWEHEEVRIKAYQGFAEFVHLNEVLPASEIGSSSGLGNFVREYLGPVLTGLSKSFGVGLASLVPISTVAPVVSGIVQTTNVLTCSTGTWLNSPVSYLYQWLRDGVVISGQETSTYTIQVGDVGSALSCVVWAVNARGTSSFVNSNAVTPLV